MTGPEITPAGPRRKPNATAWKPGQSGNPAGKPKGTRHRATQLAAALLEGEIEGVVRKTIELALAGDVAALRLVLERILAPVRDRPATFALPAIEGTEDAVRASVALVAAVAGGQLTPSEAASVAAVLEAHRKALELNDIARRVAALEADRND